MTSWARRSENCILNKGRIYTQEEEKRYVHYFVIKWLLENKQ
jgi:hypothetical protein